MNYPSLPLLALPPPAAGAVVLPVVLQPLPAAAPLSPRVALQVEAPAAPLAAAPVLPALDLPSDVATACAPGLAEACVGLACDLALVLDARGIIQSVAAAPEGALHHALSAWIGRALADCLSADCRHKAQDLLADVTHDGLARRREVTLLTVPPTAIAFAALRLGTAGPLLVLGQDLQAAAQLQQRFLLAQRDLEKGYQQALDLLAQRPALPPTAHAVAAMARLLPAAARLLAPHSGDSAASSGTRDPAQRPARGHLQPRGTRVRPVPRRR